MGAHDNWLEYILIREGIYDYVDEPTIYIDSMVIMLLVRISVTNIWMM